MTKFNKLHSAVGAVSYGISAGASGLYSAVTAVYSSMSVANAKSAVEQLINVYGGVVSDMSLIVDAYSYIMPSYVAKIILMGQVGLGYEFFVPKVIRDFALNKSISIEKNMIGDNNFTNSLNKVLEGCFGITKFGAGQLHSGMYQVATEILPTIVKGVYKDITKQPISDTVLEYSKSDLELDSSNDNTAFDSIDLDSELYYSNPFVSDSELIYSIG